MAKVLSSLYSENKVELRCARRFLKGAMEHLCFRRILVGFCVCIEASQMRAFLGQLVAYKQFPFNSVYF